jgi:phosphoribosylformylglycinamidine cyclo-ligase
MSLYLKRGISAQKEEVHAAVKDLDQGLFPKAFCRIYPDALCGDAEWINVMHADGAGTKSILAYLYWKETGDISVWKGIAQDAIVMNLDDLLCVGIYDNLLFSSTIDRNKNKIPGDVLKTIISGSQEFIEKMKQCGVNIHYMGGETADVGDVVRTIAVNGTITARWSKHKLITNEKIQLIDVIIGLSSSGKATYESEYNSGIGSNGLTNARHDVLNKSYAESYPESFENSLDDNVVYIGKHRLSDEVSIPSTQHPAPSTSTVGKLLLSPTRTFAPLIKNILGNHYEMIHGMVHCSGGGQTKCLNYLPEKIRVVKDNLFEPPPVFKLIQEASNADDREMYQVFNMGTRMELYISETDVDTIIAMAHDFGIEAQKIGWVEAADKKELIIKTKNAEIVY